MCILLLPVKSGEICIRHLTVHHIESHPQQQPNTTFFNYKIYVPLAAAVVSTNGYITFRSFGGRSEIWKMLFVIALAISLAVVVAKPPNSQPCPNRPGWVEPSPGWPGGDTPFPAGMCFLFVNKPKKTCMEAQAFCQALDPPATLVEIYNSKQNQWICDMMRDSRGVRYIGLEHIGSSQFQWYSGHEKNDTNWCPGQPDNHTVEPCVVIRRPNRRNQNCCWNDIPAETKKFICMDVIEVGPTTTFMPPTVTEASTPVPASTILSTDWP
ncbi:hypothetical protein ScPMuIL_018254 [Solemya velum]